MNAAAAEVWTFEPEPASTRAARRLVSDVLEHSAPDSAVTAALVVSELATNAVLHARTPFEVRVRVAPERVRIEVHDGTRRTPVRRFFSDDAVSGRGLRLVDELCEAWGVDVDGAGKTVWAEVPIAPAAEEAVPFDLDAVEDW